MLWGCEASTGTGNLVKVEGRKESTQYQQILGNNVQEPVRKLKFRQGWLFQQDNDPCIVQNLPRNSCRGTDRMF